MIVRRVLAIPALAVILVASGCGDLEVLSTREALERLNVATTKLFAADGSLVANLHGEIDREIAPLSEIPRHAQRAVVAIEDRRFWTHGGIDLRAITRAAVRNAERADVQGGSTISQQLVKNLYFPDPDRTVARKAAEAKLALDLERTYSKPKILEMYLNTVYFGRGVYGIRTASHSYFRKDPPDLTVSDAAFLAGLIHEPARYEWSEDDPPERQEERRTIATQRRNRVLRDMQELGFISASEMREALDTQIALSPPREQQWRYPYFADAVLRELGVLTSKGVGLDPRFDFLGRTREERAKSVYRGGLRIYTTVDPRAQEGAERAITETLPENLEKLSAALTAVEPGTGFVRALVGGRNYYPHGCADQPPEATSRECRLGKVNLALGTRGGGSGRQPGSSFKTFVLASALEHGVSLQRSFSGAAFEHKLPSGTWKVRNYEGSGGGSLSVVDATVKSVNAAYARLEIHGLGDGDAIVGASKVADTSRRLGIPFESPEAMKERCGDDYNQTGGCTPADHVPAIALGAKEVAPIDMAGAYASFAADGAWVRPTGIEKITDASGKVVYEANPERQQAIAPGVARGVTHVLQEVIRRGTGTRARLDRPAAGKTGTSQAWRDAWFAGYVPQLAAVVWVGNPILVPRRGGGEEVESMIPRNGYPTRIAGGTYPARIWNAFMTAALEGVERQSFAPPPREFFVPQSGDETEELESPDPNESAMPELDIPAFAFEGSRRSSSSSGVPGVIGMSPAQAQSTLSQAGYRTASVRQCGGGGEGLRVWRQSPGGGSGASAGSTVTIWYNPAIC